MSVRCLLLAVRNRLRAAAPGGLGHSDRACEVMFDGRPPAVCPNLFVSVHGGSGPGRMLSMAVERVFTVRVTLSLRLQAPFDRLGVRELHEAADGLSDKADAVVEKLCEKWVETLQAANALLGWSESDAESPRPFMFEPLWFDDMADPELVNGDWFHGDAKDRECGAKKVLTFRGAKRIQDLVTIG